MKAEGLPDLLIIDKQLENYKMSAINLTDNFSQYLINFFWHNVNIYNMYQIRNVDQFRKINLLIKKLIFLEFPPINEKTKNF